MDMFPYVVLLFVFRQELQTSKITNQVVKFPNLELQCMCSMVLIFPMILFQIR